PADLTSPRSSEKSLEEDKPPQYYFIGGNGGSSPVSVHRIPVTQRRLSHSASSLFSTAKKSPKRPQRSSSRIAAPLFVEDREESKHVSTKEEVSPDESGIQ